MTKILSGYSRTFESSNSPRAGVKANNDIFKA